VDVFDVLGDPVRRRLLELLARGERSAGGLGAVVRDHVAIGDGATVGMGAVVVKDIPDGARALGVPAR